jgi:hypothetical protein
MCVFTQPSLEKQIEDVLERGDCDEVGWRNIESHKKLERGVCPPDGRDAESRS